MNNGATHIAAIASGITSSTRGPPVSGNRNVPTTSASTQSGSTWKTETMARNPARASRSARPVARHTQSSAPTYATTHTKTHQPWAGGSRASATAPPANSATWTAMIGPIPWRERRSVVLRAVVTVRT